MSISTKAKKTTRVCKICSTEKPLSEFGPTASQVACKGACLKAYSVEARARRKARLAQASAPVRTGPSFDLAQYLPSLI